MTDQLVLIDIVAEEIRPAAPAADAVPWLLDPATCAAGRRGVAQARRALRAARTTVRTAIVARPDLPAAA